MNGLDSEVHFYMPEAFFIYGRILLDLALEYPTRKVKLNPKMFFCICKSLHKKKWKHENCDRTYVAKHCSEFKRALSIVLISQLFLQSRFFFCWIHSGFQVCRFSDIAGFFVIPRVQMKIKWILSSYVDFIFYHQYDIFSR